MSLELITIVALGVLLFGYKKLPVLGRALGEVPRRFKQGRQEDNTE